MRELIIAGAAAGGIEAVWVAGSMNNACGDEPWSILGYVDDDPSRHGSELIGFRVLGAPDEVAARLSSKRPWFACVIGDNAARARMTARLLVHGLRPATLVHPSASIAPAVTLGAGVYVAAAAVISVAARLGRFSLVNYGASIGHDAVLGDYSNACPGARVNGGCHLEEGAFLGSNAALLPRVRVGAWAKVGAGAAVTKDVPPRTTVVGVPARPTG